LLGADYFACLPTVPKESLVANVNIDGAGVLYPTKDVIAYGVEHSSMSEIVQKATGQVGLDIGPDPFPEETFFIRSDQYPFVRQGVPALFFFPGLQSADPEINGAAFLQEWLTTIYHSPKDDMSQDFDFAEGARYTRLYFLVGYLAANQPERPTWNPGDFFGEKFGRGH
jgi:Zn-dependent M28 family amino/carboxypeptidase